MAIFISSASTNPAGPQDGFTLTPIEDEQINLLVSSSKARGNPQLVSGFTLLEILVVVGITVVLTSMVAGYSREGGRQLALVSTETKMLNLLSRAKFLSVETFFGGGRSGDQRICAYGVKVDVSSQEMFIFQDLSSTPGCLPDNPRGNNDGKYSDISERLAGELNEVKLTNATLAFGETDLSEVIFIPPDPKTKINNSNISEASIKVKIKEGNGQFVITVNNAGQIKAK